MCFLVVLCHFWDGGGDRPLEGIRGYAVSTVVTWLGGLLIDRRGKAQAGILHKKQVIILCFLFNIGILMFFKYSGFLIANLNFLLEKIQICRVRSPDVVLPVGISFYTFQGTCSI